MTANIEVARQAEAPGALISRGSGKPLQPRPASRQHDVILIVIVLAAAANLALQQGGLYSRSYWLRSGVQYGIARSSRVCSPGILAGTRLVHTAEESALSASANARRAQRLVLQRHLCSAGNHAVHDGAATRPLAAHRTSTCHIARCRRCGRCAPPTWPGTPPASADALAAFRLRDPDLTPTPRGPRG